MEIDPENPYMQYFCGIKEFSRELLFVPSLMVTFRKRFSDDVLRENNDNGDDRPNDGALIMDTTYAPANKHHLSTEIKLCNEAREKSEQMVEAMHERGNDEKLRLDKNKAWQAYLKVAKSKKRTGNILRKANKKQLSYIRHNLNGCVKFFIFRRKGAKQRASNASNDLRCTNITHKSCELPDV